MVCLQARTTCASARPRWLPRRECPSRTRSPDGSLQRSTVDPLRQRLAHLLHSWRRKVGAPRHPCNGLVTRQRAESDPRRACLKRARLRPKGTSMSSKSGRCVLVTGAAGFIGSHLVIRLLERGDHVIGLDNLNDYYDPERKRANLLDAQGVARQNGRLTFVEGDIRNRGLLDELLAKHALNGVAHLAAMAGVR